VQEAYPTWEDGEASLEQEQEQGKEAYPTWEGKGASLEQGKEAYPTWEDEVGKVGKVGKEASYPTLGGDDGGDDAYPTLEEAYPTWEAACP